MSAHNLAAIFISWILLIKKQFPILNIIRGYTRLNMESKKVRTVLIIFSQYFPLYRLGKEKPTMNKQLRDINL
jgi:hypothetical protein